ncbi:MAG: S1C family serine protease [Propionibacteriaceae bacterium]|jgi:S1-C subfamily serine protease|nr:S1C family serine protease [Propionibacteriaceae bacterium]
MGRREDVVVDHMPEQQASHRGLGGVDPDPYAHPDVEWSVYPDTTPSQSASYPVQPVTTSYPVNPPRRSTWNRWWIAAATAVVVLVVGLVASGLMGSREVTSAVPYGQWGQWDPESGEIQEWHDAAWAGDPYADLWYSADPSEAAGTVRVSSQGTPVTTGLVVSVGAGEATVVVPYHAVAGRELLQAEQVDGVTTIQAPAQVVGFDVTHDLAVLRVLGWPVGSVAALAASDAGSHAATVVSRTRGDEAMEISGDFDVSSGSDYAQITIGDPQLDQGHPLGMVRDLIGLTLEGSSGDDGVLFNQDGAAIGLVIRSLPEPGRSGQATSVYAVPISQIRTFAATVAAGKDSGNVRVGPAGDLGFDLVWESATAQDSVTVTALTPGGAAEQAGMTVSDRLVSIDGISMRHVQGAQIGPEGVIRMLEPGSAVIVEWESTLDGSSHSASLPVQESQS